MAFGLTVLKSFVGADELAKTNPCASSVAMHEWTHGSSRKQILIHASIAIQNRIGLVKLMKADSTAVLAITPRHER
jgi:hypothetical protein